MAMSMKVSRAVAARPAVRAQAVKPQAMRIAQAAGLSLASFAVALSASAGVSVKLGADSGALVFDPASVTISAGDTVTWTNNVGFPHNIVFDEDAVPEGVNADALSHDDYLNTPGETYSVTLKTPGTYGYYCDPHKAGGSGMVGTITVN